MVRSRLLADALLGRLNLVHVRNDEAHGLRVSLRPAFGRQKPQGESFLKEAMAAGADLLLKGAYTQSRLRQMIFGGATRHILAKATLPVLMAH